MAFPLPQLCLLPGSMDQIDQGLEDGNLSTGDDDDEDDDEGDDNDDKLQCTNSYNGLGTTPTNKNNALGIDRQHAPRTMMRTSMPLHP